jgi:aldose 1-epimerase
MARNLFWHKRIDLPGNPGAIVLGYTDITDSANNLEAWIAPLFGSNLCRFMVGGNAVINFEPDLLQECGDTGTLVLYPTPNRVKDGVLKYRERLYPQIKGGIKVVEHGLVRSEAWSVGEVEISAGGAQVRTWVDFDPSSPLFEAFPFRHRLELEYGLTHDGVQVTYTIHNHDDQDIPFGFGLHPYFMRLSGDDGTSVTLPARYVMENTLELLPTGKLVDVAGTLYDLRQKTKIGALDLDHVFTGIPDGTSAAVHYESLGLSVTMQATSDFSYLVLYSPPGQPYFCLENQTCSTNAHNLYDSGFRNESGLKFVRAHQTFTGCVKYSICKEN